MYYLLRSVLVFSLAVSFWSASAFATSINNTAIYNILELVYQKESLAYYEYNYVKKKLHNLGIDPVIESHQTNIRLINNLMKKFDIMINYIPSFSYLQNYNTVKEVCVDSIKKELKLARYYRVYEVRLAGLKNLNKNQRIKAHRVIKLLKYIDKQNGFKNIITLKKC